jgi:tripartite-type tricarboxylate transporter receptor subunit TctC
MNNRRQFLETVAVTSLGMTVLGAQAQSVAWPSQVLKIIVPFPAGGTSDVIARLISVPLGEILKTQVVVENRTGANGSVGAGVVAQSSDSHTMLLSDMSSVATAPLIIKDLPFKPTDLQGVTMLAYSPHMLVAAPSQPFSNLKEMIEFGKKNKINVASSGTGSANHLGMVEIAQLTGINGSTCRIAVVRNRLPTPPLASRTWC